MKYRAIVLFAALFIANLVQADPARTVQFLLPPDFKVPSVDDVVVVVDGNEDNRVIIVSVKDHIWTGTWENPKPTASFNAADSIASVRTPRFRTECRKSASIPVGKTTVGRYTFDYNEEPVQVITIDAGWQVELAYIRRMMPAGHTEYDARCREYRFMTQLSTPVKVASIRVKGEELSLQLGRSDKDDPDAPALVVWSIDGGFDPAVLHYAKVPRDSYRVVLKFDAIIHALRLQGKNDVQIDLFRKALQGAQFAEATFTVRKP
jgi:hypothetical protein